MKKNTEPRNIDFNLNELDIIYNELSYELSPKTVVHTLNLYCKTYNIIQPIFNFDVYIPQRWDKNDVKKVFSQMKPIYFLGYLYEMLRLGYINEYVDSWEDYSKHRTNISIFVEEYFTKVDLEYIKKHKEELSEHKSSSQNIFSELIKKYEPVREQWNKGVSQYQNQNYREALDDIRLALEQLLRILLTSDRSLENQLRGKDGSTSTILGKYLGAHKFNGFTINYAISILKSYAVYQNNVIKHKKVDLLPLTKPEISLALNQAFLLMSFLVQVNDGVEIEKLGLTLPF
ncbi:hypothetical protein [Lactobacillus agrestimuris]|uniref:hypothetical protein n=1 Tax=Lactobacillus agrestimuris TaxID=2941328 RepID=UPI0020437761|nr:hypothetical protein [Lactobacillus agrestimuris]